MSDDIEEEIKDLIKDDDNLWVEYGNIDLIAKEVCYHKKCKSDYDPTHKEEPIDPMDAVYSQFYAEIETQVIVNLKLVNTETVYCIFKECFDRTFVYDKPEVPTKKWVLQKLLSNFSASIKSYPSKPCVLYKATINEAEIPFMLRKMEVANERTILLTKAAKELKSICQELKQSCEPLPTVLTSKHFREGQAALPQELMDFVLELICMEPKNPTEKESRQAKSLASDIVFFLTKGSVKLAKQITLGVGIKSMTNSTLVVQLS